MVLLDPLPLDQLIDRLGDEGRAVHVEHLPERAARTGTLRTPLLAEVWERAGVEALWSHQAEAIDLLRDRHSVVVATGTASGKSLCYQLPIAEAAIDPIRPGTSLALFPTKALAHDQLRSMVAAGHRDVVAATYDGDTATTQRAWVRANANLVMTNPEMLHAALLPHHAKWANFFMRLQYVVVDELHVLRGVFGSHVAHVLRRLRRVCAHYGSSPTFVFCSATIGEPARLADELCGLPVHAVTDDGSPRGPRTFVLVNPPVVDAATGARTSSNAEAASVAAALIESGHRTITFCRSRKGTELVARDISDALPPELRDRVQPYRAGFLAEERREIEDRLTSGEFRGVVATTALELGVDIGGLDACVLNGFPGTIASMWQQAGRAGRSTHPSVVVLVAGEDQLDQWLMTHPREVFDRAPEPAVVNPANPFVANPHLACAAYERPITHADERYWSDVLDDAVRDLVIDDQLRLRPTRRRSEPMAVWAGRGLPGRGVGLRSSSSAPVRIVDASGTLVGTVDEARAPGVVHPGAIYLHHGRSYVVTDLDLDGHQATVEPADGDEYTQTRTEVSIGVVSIDRTRSLGRAELHLGRVEVMSRVTGYQRRRTRSRRILANEALDLPPSQLSTRALWYVFDDELVADAGVGGALLAGSLHAAEHAAIGLLPLFTICDRWDVGGVSTPHHADTGGPTVFIHDGYPGGAGIADLGYREADRHLRATVEVIDACGCATGCPSCVQSPKCGNGNETLDKAGASGLIRAVLA